MEELLINLPLLNKQINLLKKMDKSKLTKKEIELYDGLFELLCTITECSDDEFTVNLERN